jgi:tripartite-type tricarboxylate transporter receptor subunit TctC
MGTYPNSYQDVAQQNFEATSTYGTLLPVTSRSREDAMPSRRRFLATALSGCTAGMLAMPGFAKAQTLNKTARIIVGFPPGGSLDAVARLIVSQMKGYAPSIVVENKPGAGGRIALGILKQSEADGSVIVLTPGDQLTLFPHVYKELGYDPLKDFRPVTTVCTFQFVLAVGPMVPVNVRTLADFIDWSRANPRLATFGTPGAGTRPHFLGEILARDATFQFTHVPYKGGAAAMQDLLGGQVASIISVVSNVLPHVQSSKLRALATTAERRSRTLPDVPTFRETGYPSLEAVEIFGVLVPARTPDSVVDALANSMHQALKIDEVTSGLAGLAFDVAPSSPAEFAALITSDSRRWRSAVHTSGFRPLD